MNNNVGLVLVAHSPALAQGAAELARQIGLGEVAIEPAGGDVDGGLGTSIDLVERAVGIADNGRGVLLLADIGSSVLTARTCMEFADTSMLLADAPFVEGAIAAAAAAAAGSDLAAVAEAAEKAYEQHKL